MEEDNEKSIYELEKYLANACEDLSDTSFDILTWWKANNFKYLILSMVAKDVLVILISKFSSKSAFSIGGHVLDPFRSSLNPTTIRYSPAPIDHSQMINDLEKFEKPESSIFRLL
jgi:hypothetical protein